MTAASTTTWHSGHFWSLATESFRASHSARRLYAHGLIAKIPRTHRCRITIYGRQAMGTPLYLCKHHFPNAYANAAQA